MGFRQEITKLIGYQPTYVTEPTPTPTIQPTPSARQTTRKVDISVYDTISKSGGSSYSEMGLRGGTIGYFYGEGFTFVSSSGQCWQIIDEGAAALRRNHEFRGLYQAVGCTHDGVSEERVHVNTYIHPNTPNGQYEGSALLVENFLGQPVTRRIGYEITVVQSSPSP